MGECLEGDIGEERGAVGEEQDCGTEFEQVEDGFQSSFSLAVGVPLDQVND